MFDESLNDFSTLFQKHQLMKIVCHSRNLKGLTDKVVCHSNKIQIIPTALQVAEDNHFKLDIKRALLCGL